jgi:malic enzyme
MLFLGLSGCGGLFSDEVLTTMGDNCPSPPIIFPLSNPTSRSGNLHFPLTLFLENILGFL